MNDLIAKYLFFYPVRLLRGEPILSMLKEVDRVERLDAEHIRGYQIEKFNRLLNHCYESVPYYRKSLDKLVKEGFSVRTYKDLEDIPILKKRDVQEHKAELRSTVRHRSSKRSTSGSTGQPMVFSKDRKATAFMDAVMYHTYSWHHVDIGYRQARFWGLPVRSRDRVISTVKDFLMNRIRFSAFDLSDRAKEDYLKRLKRFAPQYCYGYPSLIYEFATFLRERGLTLHDLNLVATIITGEAVVPEQLRVIEEVFGSPVVNEYGCTEVGVVAFQCPAGSMHVMSHNIILEVLRDGHQTLGEEGSVCVTELNGWGMPFVRYELGDRAILHNTPCSCGVNFPVIEVLSGRIDDYIITRSGKRVYDAILAYTLKTGVKAFKAFQKDINQLDIYIVKESQYTEELEKEYLSKLSQAFDHEIEIRFHYVETVQPEASGKFRYFVSEVNKN